MLLDIIMYTVFAMIVIAALAIGITLEVRKARAKRQQKAMGGGNHG
jgi:hypothetical protein